MPSAVGGDITLRYGIILAKSISAKNGGVKTGQSIPEVKKQCPTLCWHRPTTRGLFLELWAGVSAIRGAYQQGKKG